MTPARLRELVDAFPRLRIAVLGDYFLDKYLDVDPALAEVSIETGKTAHQVVRRRPCPGAAGTIVSNLAALGAGTLLALGFTGDDGEGYDLRQGLARLGCSTEFLGLAAERMTPTYEKPRDQHTSGLAGEHERYDAKNRQPTPPETVNAIIGHLDTALPHVDAVIVLDQVEEEDCGVVTGAVRQALAERAAQYRDVVFWADSRRRIRQFRNVIIKPNEFEAVGHDNPQPGDRVDDAVLQQALAALQAEVGAPVVATRGARGMLVSAPAGTQIPGVQLEGPVDTTGAGDSATAGAVLALAAGATLPEAALVGTLVASITVQQLATTGTASPAQLCERLDLWRKQHPACG